MFDHGQHAYLNLGRQASFQQIIQGAIGALGTIVCNQNFHNDLLLWIRVANHRPLPSRLTATQIAEIELRLTAKLRFFPHSGRSDKGILTVANLD
jgi:hypothetical protein